MQNKLRDIDPPKNNWDDIRRLEYEPGAHGPSSGKGMMFLHRMIKVRDCMNYIRTWSSFSAWQEAYPDTVKHEDGGSGDLVDDIFDQMRAVIPAWQFSEWQDLEVEIEWGSGLLLARKCEK